MDEWRPIESAPRDGTVFVAVHNRGTWHYPADPKRINCVVVYWSRDRFQQFGPDCFSPEELTHWMPLPEPPSLTRHSIPASKWTKESNVGH